MLAWLQSMVKRPQPRDTLGDRGENVAARYLRNQGMRIITRNFRCPLGEIDIVARDGNTLVFCEVKTRSYEDQGVDGVTPEDQVNSIKRHQITKAARYYLSRYGTVQPPARFDVVAVVWPNNRDPLIRHTPSAFEASF
ncbi:MAG TPA: YraN family protein [Tepidisphaeraceae bacterium]|nr:YraN family protein [Tepidisphaeraceae bacterium]